MERSHRLGRRAGSAPERVFVLCLCSCSVPERVFVLCLCLCSGVSSVRVCACVRLNTCCVRSPARAERLFVFAERCLESALAFTRVKKAIDDMVSQLLKEKEDEIKHKDFCVDEFNTLAKSEWPLQRR